MIEIICINKQGVKFSKEFDSPYIANKFINKCKYSKEVKITAIIKS